MKSIQHQLLIAATSCALLGACGDDPSDKAGNAATNAQTNSQTNGQTNGQTNANNMTANAMPNGQTNGSDNNFLPDGMALWAAADFATAESEWSSMVLETLTGEPTSFGSGDLAVTRGVQWAYVLDRNNAQVQVLSTTDLSDQGIIDVSGVAANPHAATDANGKAYVSLYNTGEIAVATPGEASWEVSRIDLSAYDTSDGNPEASAMMTDGDYVLVVAQMLENFVGVENSLLIVIDSNADEVFTEIDLGQRNAQAGIRAFGSGWAVGATGDFGANDAGIIRLTGGNGAYSVGETVIDEETLGGDLLEFVFVDDTTGYAVITLPDFSSQLIKFDTSGTVEVVEWAVSPGLGGLDVDAAGEWLAVGDRDPSDPSFRLFPLFDPERDPISFNTPVPPSGFRFIVP